MIRLLLATLLVCFSLTALYSTTSSANTKADCQKKFKKCTKNPLAKMSGKCKKERKKCEKNLKKAAPKKVAPKKVAPKKPVAKPNPAAQPAAQPAPLEVAAPAPAKPVTKAPVATGRKGKKRKKEKQKEAPAAKLVAKGQNHVANGSFESGTNTWVKRKRKDMPTTGGGDVKEGSKALRMDKPGRYQMEANIMVRAEKNYKLSYWVKYAKLKRPSFGVNLSFYKLNGVSGTVSPHPKQMKAIKEGEWFFVEKDVTTKKEYTGKGKIKVKGQIKADGAYILIDDIKLIEQ